MTFYKLSHQEADKAINSLCPLALKLFLYIRTRCPFKDSIPSFSVNDLVAQFKVHRDTILRLLRELKDLELLPLHLHSRILNVASRVKRLVRQQVEPSNLEEERSPRSSMTNMDDRGDLSPNSKPANSKPSRFTNNRFKNSDQTIGAPPKNEQSVIGQLFGAIEAIGARANQTIQAEVYRLIREVGFAAAARRVELAIRSYEEQSAKGNVRNPGGFIKRALERCFTPNDDGYRGRSPNVKIESPPDAVPISPPPAATAPPPPPLPALDTVKLQQQVDQKLLAGDRAAAVELLQAQVGDGHLNTIRSLLRMRSDWGFKLTSNNCITSLLQT